MLYVKFITFEPDTLRATGFLHGMIVAKRIEYAVQHNGTPNYHAPFIEVHLISGAVVYISAKENDLVSKRMEES